jgi:tRNA(fMet)-specific endonuclease VapC
MFLLDTNAVIATINDRPKIVGDRIETHLVAGEAVAVSSVVIFELEYGIAKSQQRAGNVARLEQFMSGAVSVLPFESEDAAVAGQVRAELERKGTPIGPYDLLIGAQALRHGAVLVTGNLKEFRRIKGLRCLDWGKR